MTTATLIDLYDEYHKESEYLTAVDLETFHHNMRIYAIQVESVNCKIIIDQMTEEAFYYGENEETGNYGPDLIKDTEHDGKYNVSVSMKIGDLYEDGYNEIELNGDDISSTRFLNAIQSLSLGSLESIVIPHSIYKHISNYRFKQILVGLYEKYVPGFDRYA